MAQILFPLFDQIVFAPIHSVRTTPLTDLLAAAEAVGVPANAASSVSEALLLAESSAGTHGAPVLMHAGNTASGRDVRRVNNAVESQLSFASEGRDASSAFVANAESLSALCVVAGSVYLVGEVRPLLLARAGFKPVAARS
jgi:folylpolyglutamate synthase/dihydropteroate synthase